MVAAAALLAEAPEQRRDVVPQDAAAVLDEQANQLAHLRREERARVRKTQKCTDGSFLFVFGLRQRLQKYLHS